MPLRNLNQRLSRGRVLDTPQSGRLAELFPSTGEHGPAYPYPSLVFPADTGKEISAYITVLPVGLTTFEADNLGRMVASGPDGVYTFQFQLAANGVDVGAPATGTLTIGAAAPTVINCTPANAGAAGLTAAITNGGLTTISCTPANAAAAGATATVTNGAVNTVACTPAGAAAGGLTATVTFGGLTTVSCAPAAALAGGLTATVTNGAAVIVTCTPANAIAAGRTAIISGEDMSEPITLARAKAHLRVVVSDDDDYISDLIVAARQMIEQRTQRAIVTRTESLAFDTFPSVVRLPWPPFSQILEISYIDENGASATLPPENYVVNDYAEPARMTRASGATWPTHAAQEAAVVITYETGYAGANAVPVPLKQWMLLAIGAMYENREQCAAGVQIYSIPEDFMGLLWQPYMVYM